MEIIGVIPARYQSSRFPGKPLVDICGKPMVWWVYQQAKKVPELAHVVVATDDERIERVCKEYGLEVEMTSTQHDTSLSRVCEVSRRQTAEACVSINGDEPLIEPQNISKVVQAYMYDSAYDIYNAFMVITDPVDVVNDTKVKVITNQKEECIALSRSPIPYPKGITNFQYKEFIGITLLTKKATEFFAATARGQLEAAEDNDLYRFLENSVPVKFVPIETNSYSVDTAKDVAVVTERLRNTLETGM